MRELEERVHELEEEVSRAGSALAATLTNEGGEDALGAEARAAAEEVADDASLPGAAEAVGIGEKPPFSSAEEAASTTPSLGASGAATTAKAAKASVATYQTLREDEGVS